MANNAVYITGIPNHVNEEMLVQYFSQIGVIKVDKRTKQSKVRLYCDEQGNRKGDGVVRYEDPEAAKAAISWFDKQEWEGSVLSVQFAESYKVPGKQNEAPTEIPATTNVSVPSSSRPGDWNCPKCNNVCFAFRKQCNKCDTLKPGGKVDVTKMGPNGLFKKEDWMCKSCGNINFAKRENCNTCGMKKPELKREERTGVGGGFNERQSKSDRKTTSSKEDGYDDFGRRKHVKKPMDRKAREAEALARLHAQYSIDTSIRTNENVPSRVKADVEHVRNRSDHKKYTDNSRSNYNNHKPNDYQRKRGRSRTTRRNRY